MVNSQKQTRKKKTGFATITIQVKPYVKRFLEINFGNPADFTYDRQAYRMLRDCLRKQSTRYDRKYKDDLYFHGDKIDILISEDDFYRFGWEITKTDTINFGRFFEERAKALMRSMVGVYISLGLPFNISINRFQEQFSFSENEWTYESIKKDFYRNGTYSKVDFDVEIYRKIEKIVLVNLYDQGTISHTLIDYHDNIDKRD